MQVSINRRVRKVLISDSVDMADIESIEITTHNATYLIRLLDEAISMEVDNLPVSTLVIGLRRREA